MLPRAPEGNTSLLTSTLQMLSSRPARLTWDRLAGERRGCQTPSATLRERGIF